MFKQLKITDNNLACRAMIECSAALVILQNKKRNLHNFKIHFL